jgi:YHS domain-containing protein
MKILFISVICAFISLAAIAGDNCPVCNMKVDREDSVSINYTGTEYEFCSENCLSEFKAEPILYMEKAICLPCGMDDANETLSYNLDETKYYFCNEGCRSKFIKNPDTYLKEFKNAE